MENGASGWRRRSISPRAGPINWCVSSKSTESRTAYLLKFGFESEFKLQPGGASFRYPKGGTGAIHHRYGYRGNDQSGTQASGQWTDADPARKRPDLTGERGPPENSGRPKRYHHRADYGACQSEEYENEIYKKAILIGTIVYIAIILLIIGTQTSIIALLWTAIIMWARIE